MILRNLDGNMRNEDNLDDYVNEERFGHQTNLAAKRGQTILDNPKLL